MTHSLPYTRLFMFEYGNHCKRPTKLIPQKTLHFFTRTRSLWESSWRQSPTYPGNILIYIGKTVWNQWLPNSNLRNRVTTTNGMK